MRLFQYLHASGPHIGAVVDDGHYADLADADPALPTDLQTLLGLPDGLTRAAAAIDAAPSRSPLAGITFLPLIADPNAIWALALNFKGHMDETGLTTSTEHPQVFMRTRASLVAHGDAIVKPPESVARAFDYEGELGVVIGRAGRHIPAAQALDHIAGFTCCNEGSVRDYQEHNRQFGLGKNFEKSGSYGPWLVTPDEIDDYRARPVITRVNGTERQNCSLTDMLFGVEDVIAYLSSGYELRVGDIVMMGTPGALPPHGPDDPAADTSTQFGRFKIPGLVHMNAGDTVEVEIPGIGILSNPIVADLPAEYRG